SNRRPYRNTGTSNRGCGSTPRRWHGESKRAGLAPDVLARLSKLERVLGKLQRLRGEATSREAYKSDENLRDRVERNFQVAVEAMIDIASHLVARGGLRVPADSGDTFNVLAESGALDADAAKKLRRWAGFRNVIVHEYAGIDDEIV